MAGTDPTVAGNVSVQKPASFSGLKRGIIMLVITLAAVGTYAWFYLRNSCKVDAVQEASVILVSQVRRYDDVYQVATDAPPDAVVIPVTVLQQILMDTQQVAVPACMRTAKSELVSYMGAVIRAFLAYSAEETNAVIRELITESETHYEKYRTEMEAINKCAPLCVR
jgi:hypothetical protein